jgi:hypothetical protein
MERTLLNTDGTHGWNARSLKRMERTLFNTDGTRAQFTRLESCCDFDRRIIMNTRHIILSDASSSCYHHLVRQTHHPIGRIIMLSSSCYFTPPSQTKILEGLTNISERVFEALFKGVSTRLGLPNVEKCFENAQNLRLGSIYFDKTHHPIGRIILSSCDFDGRIDILPSSSCSHNLVSSTNTSTSTNVGEVISLWLPNVELLVLILCSPNEDFGRPNKHFRTRFRSTFQRLVAQVEYSHP